MDNKQALYHINEWLKDEYSLTERDREALEMASKTLKQIIKIADILDGTIDHFDRDEAMDVLYEIKGVI